MKLQLATLLLTVLLSNTTALPSVDHCLTRFEDSLKETMLLKKTCDEASLRDCCHIVETSKIFDNQGYSMRSGIYYIANICQYATPFTQSTSPPVQARCNMKKSGDGGWTVLMRRTPDVTKRELFNRTWEEYENGFGNLTGEFWYGLKNMHCLTSREPMEVEIEVSKRNDTVIIMSYGQFKVSGPETSYTLHVSEQKHEGFDYFSIHNKKKFSTHDYDNDGRLAFYQSCSASYNNSGNWFHNCFKVYLTAMPQPLLWKTSVVAYDYAELRVRPKSCKTSLETTSSNCEDK